MQHDAAAVENAYRSHGPMVLRRARRILGNEDDSREVLQEIFAALVGEPAQLPAEEMLLPWLYGVTTHKCLNRLRDARTRERILRERGQAEPEGRAPSVDAQLAVREFLGELDEEHAKATVFYFMDEMTHEEIAQVMGCSRRRVGYLVEEVRARAEKRQL